MAQTQRTDPFGASTRTPLFVDWDLAAATAGTLGKSGPRVTFEEATDIVRDLKHLADVCFPAAATITLVQDNLNTHVPAALYEAFPPAEARRLAERFEWHYTPKHGSWLNRAESELSVLTGQCLDRRIEDRETLAREVDAWLARRNACNATADWRFTTEDARIKLRSLYPAI